MIKKFIQKKITIINDSYEIFSAIKPYNITEKISEKSI